MRLDAKSLGNLRQGEMAGDGARMRLTSYLKLSMFQADGSDRTEENRTRLHRGTMPKRGELLGNRCIGFSLSTELKDDGLHLRYIGGQIGQRSHRDRDLERTGVPTPPYNTHLNMITGRTMDHNLIDKTSQK